MLKHVKLTIFLKLYKLDQECPGTPYLHYWVFATVKTESKGLQRQRLSNRNSSGWI